MKELGSPITDRNLFRDKVMYGKKLEARTIVRDMLTKNKGTFDSLMTIATELKKNHPIY